MIKPFRIIWCGLAVIFLTGYLLSGLGISTKPQALTWQEFSRNPEALAHFEDREGISEGSGDEDRLRQIYESSMTDNADFASVDSARSHNPVILWAHHFTERIYRVWNRGKRSAAHPGHRGMHLSAAGQTRLNISLTMVFTLFLIGACSWGISTLSRTIRL